MKLARVAIPIGVFLLTLAAVGCSGGTSNADKTATAAAKGGANPTTAVTTSSSSPASGGTSKQITITAKDFSFSADDVTISKGDTVAITFKNSGSATHTLAFYTDDAYTNSIAGADTGNVSGGGTKTLTVKADVGLYYRCNIHPTQMKGEIEFK